MSSRLDPEEFTERTLIIGFATSDEFLEHASRNLEMSWFESEEVSRIVTWCLGHFEKHKTAPNQDIESIFMEEFRTERIAGDQAELIEEILNRLSSDYGRGDKNNHSASYLIELFDRWSIRRQVKLRMEEARELLDTGQEYEALETLNVLINPMVEEPEVHWRQFSADTGEVEWLVDGLITRGSLSMIASVPKAGEIHHGQKPSGEGRAGRLLAGPDR